MQSHYTSPIKRKMGIDGEINLEFERLITPQIYLTEAKIHTQNGCTVTSKKVRLLKYSAKYFVTD